jgi:iron complex outermembrane receptor protein
MLVILNFFKIFIFLFISLYCSILYAKNSLEKIDFDPNFFSLNKKQESAFDSPSAIYQLSSEEIRRSGVTSIPEALRLIPGIQVARMNGHTYAITVRGFNRQFSNKLLVMIDGRIIYTTLFSGIFWDLYDYVLEDIDKIEVIRGSGGALWGSNAVNGVINIITKNTKDTKGLYLSQNVGNYNKSITEIRYGDKLDKNKNYRFYLKNSNRQGLSRVKDNLNNQDGIRQDRFGFRYDDDSDLNKSYKLSLFGDFSKTNTDNYFHINNRNYAKKDDSANIMTNLTYNITNNSQIFFNSYLENNNTINNNLLKRNEKILNFDVQNFYNFNANNEFTWGIGYRQIIDDIVNNDISKIQYLPRHRDNSIIFGLIQNKFIVNDKFNVVTGIKTEKNSFVTNFQYQPNIRLSYYPNKNQTIWSSWSKSIRTPTRGEFDLYINDYGLRGNKNFGVEKLYSYEIGNRIKFNNKLNLDNTVFLNKYSNLRTNETNNNNVFFENKGKGNVYGLETVLKYKYNNNLRTELSYEYLSMNLKYNQNSTELNTIFGASDSLSVSEGSSPKHQIKLKSFYNIANNIEFDNFLFYVDNLPNINGVNKKGIPSYLRYDARFGYLPSANLDLSFGLQNVFNTRHKEFKSSLYNKDTYIGRSYFIKIAWQY